MIATYRKQPSNRYQDTWTSSMSRGTRVLTGLFVLSFALDYKGAQGGSLFQYAMAALNYAAFVGLAARYSLKIPRRGLAAFVVIAWSMFLISGSIAAVAHAVPASQYTRTIYPFFLFIEGFLVAWWVARTEKGGETLIMAMMSSAVISLIFTFWWGFHFSGVGIQRIRHQILSPLIPFLFITVTYDLLIARRRRVLAAVLLIATAFAIVLSVTRTQVAIVAGVALVIVAAWVWSFLRGNFILPAFLLRALKWGALTTLLAVIGGLFAAPDTLERWLVRSSGPHSSVTFWTRVAASVTEWHQLTSNLTSGIMGLGFGHAYRYALSFMPMVVPDVPRSEFSQAFWFPGEFMWIVPVYYAGFIFGGAVILALLWGAVRAFRAVVALIDHRTWRATATRTTAIGALGYFAFMGASLTADPFIMRLSALYLGLAFGIVARPETLLTGVADRAFDRWRGGVGTALGESESGLA